MESEDEFLSDDSSTAIDETLLADTYEVLPANHTADVPSPFRTKYLVASAQGGVSSSTVSTVHWMNEGTEDISYQVKDGYNVETWFQVEKKVPRASPKRLLGVSSSHRVLVIVSAKHEQVFPTQHVLFTEKVSRVGRRGSKYNSSVKMLILKDTLELHSPKFFSFRDSLARNLFLASLISIKSEPTWKSLKGEGTLTTLPSAKYIYRDVNGNVTPFEGHLRLTTYRLDFSGQVDIPLRTIESATYEEPFIVFKTSDMRELYISVNRSPAVVKEFLRRLHEARVSSIGTIHKSLLLGEELTGWQCYDPHIEYSRLEFATQLYDQGAEYSICASYPRYFLLPKAFETSLLLKASKHRSSNRLPVVRWAHKENNAVLCRSSQPLSGVAHAKVSQDLQLLQSIGPIKLCIVDARGLPAIVGNTLQGKGVEKATDYPNCTVRYCNIGNIHTMRKSLFKLVDAIKSKSEFIGDWLEHISLVIEGAVLVAKTLHFERSSVLVHCSDGFDRTPQLICLAKMFLDPHFRTIKGFCELLQSEWCSFGHRFHDRNFSTASAEFSPIFLQFLDVLHNVLLQHREAFEWNEELLLYLAKHLHSGKYGTFLYNCEREAIGASTSSSSVWSLVLTGNHLFTNCAYIASPEILLPSSHKLHLTLWRRYFLRDHIPNSYLE